MAKEATKRKPRSPAGALTPERIVSAAFDLINLHGVDALTMRAVGERLDCHHTALFWHFRTRADLIRAVISVAMVEMGQCIPTEGAWDDRAKTICRSVRRYLIEHPAIFGLGGTYHAVGIAPFVRALIVAAQDAGYQDGEAVAAGRMLLDLVGGYAASERSAQETSAKRLAADLAEGRESRDDVHLLLAYAGVDHEAVFEAALEALVESLRRRVPILPR